MSWFRRRPIIKAFCLTASHHPAAFTNKIILQPALNTSDTLAENYRPEPRATSGKYYTPGGADIINEPWWPSNEIPHPLRFVGALRNGEPDEGRCFDEGLVPGGANAFDLGAAAGYRSAAGNPGGISSETLSQRGIEGISYNAVGIADVRRPPRSCESCVCL